MTIVTLELAENLGNEIKRLTGSNSVNVSTFGEGFNFEFFCVNLKVEGSDDNDFVMENKFERIAQDYVKEQYPEAKIEFVADEKGYWGFTLKNV